MERLVAQFKAMGSPCELRFYGPSYDALEKIVRSCVDRIEVLEQKYSRFLNTSLVSKLNQQAGKSTTAIDEETYYLLQYAKACFDQSDGLFDITSGVLREIWNKQTSTLPSTERLEKCLQKVGIDKLEFDQQFARLTLTGMEIDFGGIVKEYAADLVVSLAEQSGIESGVVNLGGDLRCFGQSPETPAWLIGIADPQGANHTIAQIKINAGAVSTSGGYERYVEIAGRRYSHLLDPRSGWPVEGLISVSVLADQAIVAGSITTIAMLKPAEEAIDWLESLQVDFLAFDRQMHSFGDLGRSHDLKCA